MVRALVITHGKIAKELVAVVELILGPVPGLTARSNHGKSAADIVADIQHWLADSESEGEQDTSLTGPALILVDDYGGSCANAAQIACKGKSDVAILSGVNLAMLLGFVTWRTDSEYEELVRRLIQKGREAITQVGVTR